MIESIHKCIDLPVKANVRTIINLYVSEPVLVNATTTVTIDAKVMAVLRFVKAIVFLFCSLNILGLSWHKKKNGN